MNIRPRYLAFLLHVASAPPGPVVLATTDREEARDFADACREFGRHALVINPRDGHAEMKIRGMQAACVIVDEADRIPTSLFEQMKYRIAPGGPVLSLQTGEPLASTPEVVR